MRRKSARLTFARGGAIKTLASTAVALVCAAVATFSVFSPVRVLPADANSGPPWEEGMTADGIYSVHEDSVLEVQSERLVFDINTLPSLSKGQIYDASVTAEYTFHNPTDEYVTTTMAFPFGQKPYYAEDLSVAYIENPILVNGQPIEYEVRHTYGIFTEFYESVSEIRDDYVADEFFRPDLPVTIYTAKVNFTDSADMDGRVAFRLDRAPVIGEGTCCIGPFSYSNSDDRYTVWEVLSSGESVVFYVLGEDVPLDEWEWFTSAWSDRADDHIEVSSDITFTTSKSTLGELIFSNYSDDYGISRMDWYNGIMLNKLSVEYGRFPYLSWYSPLDISPQEFNAWYVYETTVAPRSSFTNSVTAPLFPTIHFNYEPRIYEFVYYLSPAAGWADFGRLEIVVNTPYYIQGSFSSDNVTFESVQGGYSASSDGLPEGELTFALCFVGTPEWASYYVSGKVTPYALVYVVIIGLPVLGLILVAIAIGIVIRLHGKKKARNSLNSQENHGLKDD